MGVSHGERWRLILEEETKKEAQGSINGISVKGTAADP